MSEERNEMIQVVAETEAPKSAKLESWKPDQVFFEHKTANIKEIQLVDEVKGKPQSALLDGQKYQLTSRFMNSIASRYGFNLGISKLFDWHEVFNRLVVRCTEGRVKQPPIIKFGVAHTPTGAEMMAASSPNKPVINLARYSEILKRNGVDESTISYQNGVITSTHHFSKMDNIELDKNNMLVPMFHIATPLDGYGDPDVCLAVQRLQCMNGIVANTKLFSESVKLAKDDSSDPHSVLSRFLESYNNEEGVDALSVRLDIAKSSSASLQEYTLVTQLLQTHFSKECSEMMKPKGAASQDSLSFYTSYIMNWLSLLAGDYFNKFGLTNDNKLLPKEKSQIPLACTVHDLIMVLTEFGTHFITDQRKKNIINGLVGSILSTRYDLENQLDEPSRFGNRKTYFTPEDINDLMGIRGAVKLPFAVDMIG